MGNSAWVHSGRLSFVPLEDECDYPLIESSRSPRGLCFTPSIPSSRSDIFKPSTSISVFILTGSSLILPNCACLICSSLGF
ncbi:hypothetical protein BO94DRAFT_531034 [Aspergillus sclerotioniger CBS 115572]|uniref:Uncharacterized protein n=1 Tax=Aspergillus sclerotioniger CBS 115572 TaxID=1450535 RepID=A0A317XBS1_9EURO|nr:hypothetical protein BO94DRAFT_531034 [Aspergillus sclerotioniger CBS 115572]PWY95132.1 hypothetical protein BO94DRAFT_531034 [Aspergillus sclerotioniger CBS 115572]